MPKVSVIIPVYNTEKYLRQCLDSVINQTLTDIEIICVDDNSTDGSLVILQEYAEKDERIKILKGKGTGAGGARNVGLDVAQGEYLSFLDSDDFFELNMFEKMYKKGIDTDSDIVICNADIYDTTKKIFKEYEVLPIPTTVKKENFAITDYPDEVFCDFKNQVWNKIFKHTFIKEHNLHFQEIKRCNDTYFEKCSMIQAKHITIINKKFVHYRFGQTNNLQSNNIETPDEFTKCFLKIKEYLKDKNLYNKYFDSYKKFVINECTYYLQTLKTYPKAYFNLKRKLAKKILPDVDINIKEVRCWNYSQIFLAWLFSVRNYRYTNYKILNILGFRIKINKRK